MLALTVLLAFFANGDSPSSACAQPSRPTDTRCRQARHRDWVNPKALRNFVVGTADSAGLARWVKDRAWTLRPAGQGLFEVEMPSDSLEAISRLPGVDRIESPPRRVRHALDASRQRIQADPVHRGVGIGRAHRGTGSLVGIVDVGFDLNHYAFLDSLGRSRIVRVWDMTNTSGKPPAGFTTGTLFSTPQAVQQLGHTGTSSSHGTHVAGLAAGRAWAAAGSYWGVADDARIALVDCGEGCQRLNDGLKYLFKLGDSLNLPVVVNMSWGTLNGPRNGTSSDCVIAKGLVGPGKVLVVSAGNSGGGRGHASHAFAGDTAIYALEVSAGTQKLSGGQVRDVFFNEVELWGDSGKTFKAWVEVLDAKDSLLVLSAPLDVGGSTWLNVNGRKLFGQDTLWYTGNIEKRSGRGGVRLSVSTNRPNTQLRLSVTAATGSVNGWIWEEGLEFVAPTAARCPGCVVPDNVNTISDKATCPYVIAVGATNGTNGTIASFSSRGPGLGAIPKPDLAAPGVGIVSALNSFGPASTVTAASGSFVWGPMSGTSMSAPLVTGTVALLLENDPKLSADGILEMLRGAQNRFSPDTGWASLNVLRLFQPLDPLAPAARLQDRSMGDSGRRVWITPGGRRIAVPAGARARDFHPGGMAWIQRCEGDACTTRGIVAP